MNLKEKVISSLVIAVFFIINILIFVPAISATILYPSGGGTGTSTAPTFGKVLVGNSGGTYTLTATSSLGLTTSPASPSASIQYNNSGVFGGSANATLDGSGNAVFKGTLGVGGALLAGYQYSLTDASGLTHLREQNTTDAGRIIREVGMAGPGSTAFFDMRAHGISYSETLFSNDMANAVAMMAQNDSLFVIGNVAAAPLVFGTNNTEYMRIDANGLVGIKTQAPSGFDLQVGDIPGGNDYHSIGIVADVSNDMGAFISLHNGADEIDSQWSIGTNAANNSGRLDFRSDIASAGIKMSILTSGNVGIGTTNPQTALDVQKLAVNSTSENVAQFSVSDDSVAKLLITNNTGANSTFIPTIKGIGSGTNDPLIIAGAVTTDTGSNPAILLQGQTAADGVLSTRPILAVDNYGNRKFLIDASGNVGINTTSPNAKLDIISTSNLFRAGYDTSNYFTADVGSTGAVSLNAVGSASSFNFLDNLGIGSSTPGSLLSIKGTSGSLTNLFTVASSTNARILEVDSKGHEYYGGSAPTISSCGTSPSLIDGNDNAGRIQIGSVVATSCTLTFANAWDKAPICDANVEGGLTVFTSASSTASSVLITGASAITGDVITYQCKGVR